MLLAVGVSPARADVITFNDGKVYKGLIAEEAPGGDSETISFITDTGKLRIPKTRIQQVKNESKAQGYIHIGNAFVAKQSFGEAIKAYQQALDLEPANQAAQQGINNAQSKIGEEQQLNRKEAVDKIEALGVQARQLIGKGDFTGAEKLLKDANQLVPSAEQRTRLAKLISNLYLAWAEERQDKLDAIGAEEKLRLSLAADPNNEQVIDKMLKLWEKDPQKRKQTVNIYETILERHPEDKELRKKLGDLYYEMGQTEDAAHHYLELYRLSDEFKGTELETRLAELLDKLQLQCARQKEWDKAIHYLQILAAINPTQVSPIDTIFYQYNKHLQALKPDDIDGKMQLALYAEQNSLDEEALNLYHQLLKNDRTQKLAQEGIDRYALKALTYALRQFQDGLYGQAGALAEQVRTDFPNSTAVQEKAAELVGKANAEEVKDRRQKRELAQNAVKHGDDYYSQAQFYFNNIFSTERRDLPQLGSSRDMAKTYFQYAIHSYQEALQLDPSLQNDPTSPIPVRLKECSSLLQRLNQGAPSMPRDFGAPIAMRTVNIPTNTN